MAVVGKGLNYLSNGLLLINASFLTKFLPINLLVLQHLGDKWEILDTYYGFLCTIHSGMSFTDTLWN